MIICIIIYNFAAINKLMQKFSYDMSCSKTLFVLSEPDVSKDFGGDNNGERFPVSGVQAHHQNSTSGYHGNPQFVATARRHSTGRERSPATTPVIKRARRKFPGPAGLLPKLVKWVL